MCECSDKAAKAKGKSAKPPMGKGKTFGKAATKPPVKPKGKGKAGK